MGKFSGFMAGACWMAAIAEKWNTAAQIEEDRRTFASDQDDCPIPNWHGVQMLLGKAGNCLDKAMMEAKGAKDYGDVIKLIRYGVLLMRSLRYPIDTKKAFKELGMKDIFEKYKEV